MSNQKNKWFIIPACLVFLALMGLIVWLVHIILNFRLEEALPETYSVVETTQRLYEPADGPVEETLIRIEDEDTIPYPTGIPDTKEPETPAGPLPVLHGHGHIPAVCETHGAQIQSRKAFNNPLIHTAIVNPTRVSVHLMLEPEGP